jgi:uncharacterized repeat protein (TIGR01451 family)
VRRLSIALLALIAAVGVTVAVTRAAFTTVGPPIVIFAIPAYNGTSTPPTTNDPASFNTAVYGSTIPPAAQQQSGTPSSYNGTGTDITANGNQPQGVVQVACTNFTYTNSPACVGPASLPNNTFIAVQSWPFYVGGGSSSNVTAGSFSFQTNTDDGSWFVLAGSPFTYAQPGNFNNTTALVPGTAVVNNGGIHASTSVYSTFTIPTTGQCATNLYYLTFEYLEAAGGAAYIGYQWQPPGASSYQNVSQAVLWGQVLYNGAPDAGVSVKVPLPSGGSTTLTTDANGCYGENFASTWSGTTTISNVVATDATHSASLTQSATVPMGCTIGSSTPCATYLEFDLGKSVPNIVLYKRITKVVSGGVTTVPTPDPGPTGLAGTVTYTAGLKPNDQVTYTIYFSNAGSIPAQGKSGLPGPTLSDPLNAHLTLSSVSAAACCANPSTSITITPSSTGNTASWQFAAPLPTANPHTPTTIQGSVSVTATVN